MMFKSNGSEEVVPRWNFLRDTARSLDISLFKSSSIRVEVLK